MLLAWLSTETHSLCAAQESSAEEEGVSLSADGQSLIKDGVHYNVGDQVYLHPDTFDHLEQAAQAEVPDYAAKGRFHKVCLLQPLLSPPSCAQNLAPMPKQLLLRLHLSRHVDACHFAFIRVNLACYHSAFSCLSAITCKCLNVPGSTH